MATQVHQQAQLVVHDGLPFPDGLSEGTDKGKASAHQDLKAHAHNLAKKYEWAITETWKIMALKSKGMGSNILSNISKGIQYMDEIKDSVVGSF